MARLTTLALVLAGLLACESGTSETHSFTLTSDTLGAFSPESPGLLRVERGLARVLCGQTDDTAFDVYFDNGLGCLEDGLKGTDVTRLAWVEPVSEGFDQAALCGLPKGDRDPIHLTPEFTGEDYTASVAPEEGWIQTSTVATWKRASICGGRLPVEHQL